MSVKFTTILAVSLFALGGCASVSGSGTFGNSDGGIDSTSLETMTAGIWIDGNGCDHWIIDDGMEGFMAPRLNRDGTPVCREGSVPFQTQAFERSLMGL